ncbi:MAG: hypothetical protein KatS3mg019_2385 [Fimbriimonadales bacterium]|nr:MAG: hypothetical protein KatS3mg019_2385 [Fimbriimonadales bacterium]
MYAPRCRLKVNMRLFVPIVLLCVLYAYACASHRQVYRVQGESTSRFWLSALQRAAGSSYSAPDTPDLDLTQRYRYQLILQSLGEQEKYVARWRQWSVETKLTPELKQFLEQIQQLSPAYFRRRGDGSLELFIRDGMEAWQRQAVATILSPFQFVRPDLNRTEWQVEESHPSGNLVTRYRLVRREKSGVQVFNKAVVAVKLSPEEKQLGKTHQVRGHLQYRINSQGVILAIEGELREEIGLQGLPTSYTATRLSIRLEHRTPLKSTEVNAQRAVLNRLQGRWSSLYAPPTPEEQENASAQALLSTITPQQLLEQLDTMLSRIDQEARVAPEEQSTLQRKLIAAITLYKGSFVKDMIERLKSRTRADDGFWLLIGALSQSEQPEAHRALVEAFDHCTDLNQRFGLAQQFSFLKAPRPDIVNQLWERAKAMPESDLKQALLISVANLARRLPNSEVYRPITEWSRQQAQAASDDNMVRFWLTVLGALGDVDSLALLERYARTGDEMTRLRAVEAMGSLPSERALSVFETLYSIEPSATVRAKMITATAQWWSVPKARTLLERAAMNDPALSVRKACVQLLTQLAQNDSEALNLMVAIATTNSDASVRREAMIALAALRAAGVKVPPIKANP